MSKFNKGDVCNVLYGQKIFETVDGKFTVRDLHPEWIGEKVRVDYSYKEIFGGEESLRDSYSVTFLTGPIKEHKVAWFLDNQLELYDSNL